MTSPFPNTPEEFTPAFVEDALGAARGSLLSIRHEPVGTGQVCDSYRFICDWKDGPDKEARPNSFVAKCPSHDAISRGAAALFHLYAMEAGWYRDVAANTDVRCPKCYHAAIVDDEQNFVLMLEDMAPAQQGDQLSGASLIQVETTLAEAAALHSYRPKSGGLDQYGWALHSEANSQYMRTVLPARYHEFRERFAALLATDILDLGQQLIARLEDYVDHDIEAPVLTHGDMRLDNILFHSDGRLAALVDWQTCTLGNPANDVAYMIGTSFADPAVRRAEEERLVSDYLKQVTGSADADLFWHDYRRCAFSGFLMAINAGLHVEQTDRGDEMFAMMAQRPAQMALDHDSIALI